MERHYVYQALTPWLSIRLLRLAPSLDASGALHGHMFECALEDVYDQAFPYEALSYVWGDPVTRHAIKIDGLDLPVTANLHAALMRLRDKRHERLLWVDALCIDQRNDEEKEHQIQLMYQIYACASCAVVWLGEEDNESDEALEDLRIIGKKDEEFEDLQFLGIDGSTTSGKNDCVMERIGNLFQRAWFRRVWVLQEVGAARRVQIRCGNAALDGYAFALAATKLGRSFRVRGVSQALQQTIQSTAYLIKGSIFRPPYQTTEALSERVGSFGELMDMFHDREATVPHDKIFALLGMSSDDMSKSGLLPDYKLSREELFRRMVEFILSDKISIECQKGKEAAVIKARGSVLGHICSVSGDSISGNMQTVSVRWSPGFKTSNEHVNDVDLLFQVPAIPLQEGDIICILDGATDWTIMRLYRDFSVIVVAATPPQELTGLRRKSVEQAKLPKYGFVLIWDWDYHADLYSRWRTYESWAVSNDWASSGTTFVSNDQEDVLARQVELALIYQKERGWDHSKERIQELLSSLDTAIQAEELQMKARHSLSAFLCGIAGRFSGEPDLQMLRQAGHRTHTEFFWAIEKHCKIVPSILVEAGLVEIKWNDFFSREITKPLAIAARNGDIDNVNLLLKEGAKVDGYHNDWNMTALQAAAGAGHLIVVERLLQGKAEVNALGYGDSGRTALQAAAGAGHMAVVERLLREGANLDAPAGDKKGRTALQATAEGGHMSILDRLIQEKADVNAKAGRYNGRTAIQAAAGSGHLAVVDRLVQKGADVNAPATEYGARTALQAAAEGGHLAVMDQLLQEKADINAKAGEVDGRTALQAASEAGHLAVVDRLIQKGADVNAPAGRTGGKTALEAAVKKGHMSVVKRLIQGEADINAPLEPRGDTVLTIAAQAGNLAMLEYLLEAKAEVNAKDLWGKTPIEHASEGGHLAVVERLKAAGALTRA